MMDLNVSKTKAFLFVKITIRIAEIIEAKNQPEDAWHHYLFQGLLN